VRLQAVVLRLDNGRLESILFLFGEWREERLGWGLVDKR
jgi:hypothetical protein